MEKHTIKGVSLISSNVTQVQTEITVSVQGELRFQRNYLAGRCRSIASLNMKKIWERLAIEQNNDPEHRRGKFGSDCSGSDPVNHNFQSHFAPLFELLLLESDQNGAGSWQHNFSMMASTSVSRSIAPEGEDGGDPEIFPAARDRFGVHNCPGQGRMHWRTTFTPFGGICPVPASEC